MKKILTLVLILLLSYVSSYSQICNWAENLGGYGGYISKLSCDENNNVYLAGYFANNLYELNNGISLSSTRWELKAFIAKYNSSGICQWAVKMESNSHCLANGTAVDKYGNVYVTGMFWGDTLRLNNGITCSEGSGIIKYFIAKYSSSGLCQWAVNITNSDYYSTYQDIFIAIDGNSKIYVTGFCFSKSVYFNNGIFLTRDNFNSVDIFLAKYNENGLCQWAEIISGDNGIDRSSDISVDKNSNIYVTGSFNSQVLNFNNSISLSPTIGSKMDTFICKYNSNGKCQWAEKISGDGDDFALRTALDGNNNVFITGFYSSTTLNFNNNKSISKNNSEDGFLSKYNENGVCQWAENISGSGSDYSRGVSTDKYGNVYITGDFSSPEVIFNNNKSITKIGGKNSFIAKYDNSGNCKWVENIYCNNNIKCFDLTITKSGLLYNAGTSMSDTIFFNNKISIPLLIKGKENYLAQYSLFQEPEILTLKPVKITATTAMSGGSLVNDGGSPVLKRGICWSKSENPTINDSVIVNETTGNLFFTDMSGLSPNTEYFVRAFATNKNGTGYGNLEKFKTLIEIPSITTKTITNVNYNSAKSGGVIISDGGDSITARGVCWSKNQNPTVADSKTVDSSGSGSFVSHIIELNSATIYYVRAYAVNSLGTAYGDEKSFKTNGVIYVNDDAKGNNNGTSWTDAFNLLQSALDGASSGDQMLVAEGTYYPTKKAGGINERNKAFQLKKGVAVYGGYSGVESPMNDRNWNINLTILSGDIGVSKDSSDNCYHVFYHPNGLNLDTTAILDGFIIKNGNADGIGEYSRGGAVFNFKSSPKFQNNRFEMNYAEDGGGAIYNNLCQPVILYSTFIANYSNSQNAGGGGVLNIESKTIISECIFVNNFSKSRGGGVFNFESEAVISKSDFVHNVSNDRGGGLVNDYHSDAIITNCKFIENESGFGGGVYNLLSSPTFLNSLFYSNVANGILYNDEISFGGGGLANDYNADAVLTNCTFSKNISKVSGGGILSYRNNTKINNSIVWGNNAEVSGNEMTFSGDGIATINYSCFSNSSDDVSGSNFNQINCIYSNPEFAGQSNTYEYSLVSNSSCIDKGNNSYNVLTTDIRGEGFSRKLNPKDGSEGIVDIGAYEYKYGYDKIQEQELSIPFLISPANGQNSVATTFKFLWHKVKYASAYNLQISVDSTFKQINKTALVLDTNKLISNFPIST